MQPGKIMQHVAALVQRGRHGCQKLVQHVCRLILIAANMFCRTNRDYTLTISAPTLRSWMDQDQMHCLDRQANEIVMQLVWDAEAGGSKDDEFLPRACLQYPHPPER